MSTVLTWAAFMACALAILFSGSRLARFGDVIAEKTGLGRTWVGLVLLATATSLPELVSGVSAAGVFGLLDIAVGNALGACIVNLAMIALLDIFFYGSGPILARAERSHQMTAGFGVVLFAVVGLSVAAGEAVLSVPGLGVAVASLLIIGLYALAMRLHYLTARRAGGGGVEGYQPRYADTGLGGVYRGYAIHATVILVAGTWLPSIGADLARLMHWEQALVGSVLLAVTTTMPEAVTSVAALRLGAPDLAVANLLGSNIFNVTILAIDDIVYRPGPIFAAVSPVHVTSALVAVVLSAVVVVGLSYRAERKTDVRMGLEGLAILAVYVSYLVWFWRHGAA